MFRLPWLVAAWCLWFDCVFPLLEEEGEGWAPTSISLNNAALEELGDGLYEYLIGAGWDGGGGGEGVRYWEGAGTKVKA